MASKTIFTIKKEHVKLQKKTKAESVSYVERNKFRAVSLGRVEENIVAL